MSKSFPKPTTAGRTSSASQPANNGLVNIENDGGRLRLRFSYGNNLPAVAEQTGHNLQILFKHYASVTQQSVIQQSAVMVEF